MLTRLCRGKRKFQKTDHGIYVIQEHRARHLHWDLRLELDGILKSWALPKEPPLKTNVRWLAISVEDHPIEYADFEGKIPQDQYGAGEVLIWDIGTYELIALSERKVIASWPLYKMKDKRSPITT